jgi:electron transfer flavoprotein alpha subunit
VENLAEALGAIGASRAVVDPSWYPRAFQVGQTGKTVFRSCTSPAGISGAFQHRGQHADLEDHRRVNKDEEAPIFELVDFGVVRDLHWIGSSHHHRRG